MKGRCAHLRGSSPAIGTSTPTVKWVASQTDNATAVIAADGTIYAAGGAPQRLKAIRPDGTTKWTWEVAGVAETPAIGVDGSVFFGGQDNSVYAVGPDGVTKWALALLPYQPPLAFGDRFSSTTIGPDGTVYLGHLDPFRLYAITPDGHLKWSVDTDGGTGMPAIGPSGTVYVGVPTGVRALDAGGSLLWSALTDGNVANLAITEDETVIASSANGSLFAFSSVGDVIWTASIGGPGGVPPVIAQDGAIHVGGDDGNIHSFSPTGAPLWTFDVGTLPGAMAIDGKGTIFVVADLKVVAVTDDGLLKWSVTTKGSNGAPAIGLDSNVYFPLEDGLTDIASPLPGRRAIRRCPRR